MIVLICWGYIMTRLKREHNNTMLFDRYQHQVSLCNDKATATENGDYLEQSAVFLCKR